MGKTPSSWTSLQDYIQSYLVSEQKTRPLMWQRFYDTRSAGSYIPAQPADFGVLYQGRWSYIEAKYSEVHKSLRSCAASGVSLNQIASAKLTERAKGSYWFIFYSDVSKQFEVWPGGHVSVSRRDSRPLQKDFSRTFSELKHAIEFALANVSYEFPLEN